MQRGIFRSLPIFSSFEFWTFYLDHSELGIMFSWYSHDHERSVNRSVSALPVGLSTCPRVISAEPHVLLSLT